MVGNDCLAIVERGRARQGPEALLVTVLQNVEALGIGCLKGAGAQRRRMPPQWARDGRDRAF